MLDCLVMGDSIAVGIGQARPDCFTVAQVGITSDNWFKQYNPKLDKQFKVVVISLGTNDYYGVTAEYLYKIRKNVKANAVVWILPSYSLKPKQRVIIREISNEFGDKVLDITEHVGRDGIHPPSLIEYRKIGDKTRKLGV